MSGAEPAKQMIAHELQAAIERLHDDIARVEFWADALDGFARPIPDYHTADSRLDRFILPERKSGAESKA